jgi:cyclic pyranopterin phosphate synthase
MGASPLAFRSCNARIAFVEDAFGHRIAYLRVSITDRCNERCRYCMPEEEQAWFPSDEILDYDELLRVVRIGTGLGIHKLRVTGGEPLTRPGAVDFCRRLAALDGIDQLGISSNGTLLAKKVDGVALAQQLVEAGVDSVNISLDSLDPEAYRRSTNRDLLGRVLRGIDAARAAGFGVIKINCVLMRGQTERELVPLIRFAHEKGLLLRFIELMPVSTLSVLSDDNFLSCGSARKLIEAELGSLEPDARFRTNGPASYYRVPQTGQRIGFIGAMTNLHFCENCDKLRLTADGKLRPCLGSFLEFDMRRVIREGASDVELAEFFESVVARKPKEHEFRDNYQPNRKMIAIGG